MKKNILVLGTALLLTSSLSYAESVATAPTQSSTNTMFSNVKKNLKASYTLQITGSSPKHLTGDTGEGMNLDFIHFATLGYKLSSKWSVSATQPFVQNVDEKPSTEVDPLVVTDPYITFTNNKILHSDKYGFDLNGYIRYYAPVSRTTKQNVDRAKASDMGYGKTRLFLNPSKSFMDGALTAYVSSLTEYRFAKNTEAARLAANGDGGRNDWSFDTIAGLSYDLLSSLSVYAEYETGFINHTVGGNKKVRWSKLTDGQTINIGATVSAIPKMSITPEIDIEPKAQGLSNASMVLTMSYIFM